MRFRKLRIAWSVGWGVVCLLLFVLWAQSYYRTDIFYVVDKSLLYTTLTSSCGTAYLVRWDRSRSDLESSALSPTQGWEHSSYRWPWKTPPSFAWSPTAKKWTIQLPTLPLVVPFILAAAIPWLRWRFSLRTLLIATTLVAVVLGLIVWLR